MSRKLAGILKVTMWRGSLIALLAVAGLGWQPPTAHAQDRQIRALDERVKNLEDQLRALTRYLSKNPDAPRNFSGAEGGGTQTGGSASPDQLANMEVRLTSIEDQMRALTGQIEEARHDAQMANERTQHQVDALEARLERLEKAGGISTGTAAAGGTATAPATEQAAGQPAEEGATATPSDEETVDVGEAKPLPSGDPTALYNASLARLRQEDYTGAAAGFEEFLSRFPKNQLAANAQYWLGEAYYARQDYSNAARSFLTAYSDYPKSSKASGALLKLGISLGELDQKQDACAALREFAQKYPNASPVETNRAAVARKKLNCP